MKRQLFVSSLAAISLGGCTSQAKQDLTDRARVVLDLVEPVNHALIGTRGMAKLYRESDIERSFRVNGLDTPADMRYLQAMQNERRGYRLAVTGLVEKETVLSLPELRALPQVAQITRHDCVEGWSAVGKWAGPQLATVLAMARPKPEARYVVFRCFDKDQMGNEYYESLDLHQAAHPQTLLSLDLNDAPLDPDHGAPVRLRIPTQLGYKSAKWVRGIELAATRTGKGGYWEDQGYEWYAGI